MRRILKWIGIGILIPVSFFLLLALLLYWPPVQNWAVRQFTAIASEKTGLDISVEHVHLKFPLDLRVDNVKVILPNDSLPQQKDTIAVIEGMDVDVQFLPLLKKKVEIDGFTLKGVQFNTVDFITSMRLKGKADHLSLTSHGIDLKQKMIRLDDTQLKDADVEVMLTDSTSSDTTKTENHWKINVDKLAISNSRVAVRTPGDSLRIAANIDDLKANGGVVDLESETYIINKVDWKGGSFKYDNPYEIKTDGLDYNHLSMSDVNIGIDSLYYHAPDLRFSLRDASMKEKSGLDVSSLSGNVTMKGSQIDIPDLSLQTSESSLKAHVSMDLDKLQTTSLTDHLNDQLKSSDGVKMSVDASLGKQDMIRLLKDMPNSFIRQWPNQSLSVKTVVQGNLQNLSVSGLNAKLPGAFNINANGTLQNLNDLDRLKADVTFDAKTYDVGFLKGFLDPSTAKDVRIPSGIGLSGNAKVDGKQYHVNGVLTEGNGRVKAVADIDAQKMQYKADLDAHRLNIRHFLPHYDMGPMTGKVKVHGTGTDIFSRQTRLNADVDITQFTYGDYNLDKIKGSATVRNGRVNADILADNPLLQGNIQLDALMNKKRVDATVSADIHHADLRGLRLTEDSITTAFCCHVDVATDLKDYYKVQGLASDLSFYNKDNVYRPDDIVMDILTRRDTTHAVVDCGDFHLDADASGGYKKLLAAGDKIMKELEVQRKNRRIDQSALRALLPHARIKIDSGKDNFFARILEQYGYTFNQLDVNLLSSPVEGLNGQAEVLSLLADSMQLDTIRLAFQSDSTNIHYRAQVRNNENNPQFVFNTLFNGTLLERGLSVNMRYYDQKDKLGIRLGAEAMMEENGIRVHLSPDDAVIAYRKASINENNYLFLADNRRVSANVEILAEDGTGMKLYSNDDNPDVLQDLTLSLNKLDLAQLTSVLPYFPSISGIVNGDYHIEQNTEHLTVSSSMGIDKLTYEGNTMGDLGLEFVYMPTDEGGHYVDGILSVNEEEVGTIGGIYQKDGTIEATANLTRLPMSLVNGFIPNQVVGLQGYGEGELAITGPLSSPIVNGELKLDSCHLVSVPYGMDLKFSDRPITIADSRVKFNNYEMYAHNNNPMRITGDIDFSNLDRMTMNLRMIARQFLLIDTKENNKSIAYGKAFVNFFGNLSGPVENLLLRGKLDVLGTTDMSYILRDSPLTTDNQLDELVKFTDFSDTTQTIVSRPQLTGFNMDLTVDITQGAHVMAYLNADKSNYVDLMGGGTLRMMYNPTDNLRLTGKYTLNNGEMKYSLPIIPLKTFTIQDGSYIEFTGDMMNPKLNITATERTKATVTGTNGVGHSVDFDCGVIITKTLKDMGLEFTLDSPEDLTLHNELMSMSKEQRGKLAVTMLTTGMYLADGNTSGFSMNSALSSFLESEISNITGNALRTLDLSIGLDNTTDASGGFHTDYSFKFAKRFWNNRLKISVGGKVSTGSQMPNQNASIFDNVSMEYRLDDTANKYIKLFFNNNAYDWLEGYTQEYGGGFIWRRTIQHFKDIFRLKDDSNRMPSRPADTTKVVRPDTLNAVKRENP
ncbi:MAG: translocation/assembly module TamB domain-containing protein [Prevotella sp.]|nr:translocation/assembly module TamB domain-containing protein [Prevotella sp.]